MNIKIFFAVSVGLFLLSSCTKNEYESDGVVSPIINLNFVKKLHNGDDVILEKEKLMGATKIAGVVISDRSNGNFKENEFVLQNFTKGVTTGVIVQFKDASNTFDYGDSVQIDIEDAVLFREKGSLKIKGDKLSFSNVTKFASNMPITPKLLTQTQLYSEFATYESTLVQVNNIGFQYVVGGEIYAGDRKLGEDGSNSIYLSTEATASFANKFLPLSASFIGIPTYYNSKSDYYNTAKLLLKMRTENDAFNETGAAYPNYPEDFELAPASSKNAYLMPAIDNKVTFKTGVWRIYQGIIGNTINVDRFNPTGAQAIRMQEKLSESAYLEMDFDLPLGASKVTLTYANPAVGAATASTFDLEYSTDQGQTWTKAGESVSNVERDAKLATFNVNIVGAVRFRINKLGLGNTTSTVSNGLLNIDDFKVYQNVD